MLTDAVLCLKAEAVNHGEQVIRQDKIYIVFPKLYLFTHALKEVDKAIDASIGSIICLIRLLRQERLCDAAGLLDDDTLFLVQFCPYHLRLIRTHINGNQGNSSFLSSSASCPGCHS